MPLTRYFSRSKATKPPPFDPDGLLTVANELAKNNDEASIRTAVNRLYYAAFWYARRDVSLDQDDSADIHQKVIIRLKPKNVSDKLQRLLWLRKAADYEAVPRRPEHYDWG